VESLASEVRDFEPRTALDGGADGLTFVRQLSDEARDRLRAGGQLMIEFSDGQASPVERTLSEGGWIVEGIKNDLSDRPRIVVARHGKG
jgi:release factor glutamine methyltransferase